MSYRAGSGDGPQEGRLRYVQYYLERKGKKLVLIEQFSGQRKLG
jgi:hypothetical protein